MAKNEFTPTYSEHASEQFDTEVVRQAISALHKDGFVVINDFLSGNTNVPGSGLQPVHVDDGQL